MTREEKKEYMKKNSTHQSVADMLEDTIKTIEMKS